MQQKKKQVTKEDVESFASSLGDWSKKLSTEEHALLMTLLSSARDNLSENILSDIGDVVDIKDMIRDTIMPLANDLQVTGISKPYVEDGCGYWTKWAERQSANFDKLK